MNVALWLERFDEALRLRGFTENTRTGYGYTVRRFLEFLCDRQITMVSEYRAKRWTPTAFTFITGEKLTASR